jgi:hypothetical protein
MMAPNQQLPQCNQTSVNALNAVKTSPARLRAWIDARVELMPGPGIIFDGDL